MHPPCGRQHVPKSLAVLHEVQPCRPDSPEQPGEGGPRPEAAVEAPSCRMELVRPPDKGRARFELASPKVKMDAVDDEPPRAWARELCGPRLSAPPLTATGDASQPSAGTGQAARHLVCGRIRHEHLGAAAFTGGVKVGQACPRRAVCRSRGQPKGPSITSVEPLTVIPMHAWRCTAGRYRGLDRSPPGPGPVGTDPKSPTEVGVPGTPGPKVPQCAKNGCGGSPCRQG